MLDPQTQQLGAAGQVGVRWDGAPRQEGQVPVRCTSSLSQRLTGKPVPKLDKARFGVRGKPQWTCPPASPPRPQFDLLEMDRLERPLVNLPLLLDPSSYVPDTVDLTDDAQARKYWLTCFEEALDGVRGVVCRARGPMLRSEGGERGDVGFPEASLAGRLGGRLLFPGPQCSSWWVVRTVSWDAEPGRRTSCK